MLYLGLLLHVDLCTYKESCKFSARATDEFELARKKVANFINAKDSSQIVFTRNATEAINLVAYSWGLSNLKSGDEVCSFCSCLMFSCYSPRASMFTYVLSLLLETIQLCHLLTIMRKCDVCLLQVGLRL